MRNRLTNLFPNESRKNRPDLCWGDLVRAPLVYLRIVYFITISGFKNFRLRYRPEKLESLKIGKISPKHVNVTVVRVPVSRSSFTKKTLTHKDNCRNFIYSERGRSNGDFIRALSLMGLSVTVNSIRNFCSGSTIAVQGLLGVAAEVEISSNFPSIEAWVASKFIAGKYRKIIDIISDPEILKASYQRIKSKPGNMSPSGDVGRDALGGITASWLDGTSARLKEGTYHFKSSPRVLIPKSGTNSTRSLSPRDEIIQEAVRTVLSIIYEPRFSKFSYGFRPNVGCHDALRHVKC